MSTASSLPVERVSHGAVSLAAGFLAGLTLFLAIGASTADAVFSSLALAALVAVTRTLTRVN
ncbi:hypothetical protein [Haloarcula onubensis]|uniref:Uncharacterized protein n=1 Tax=Haloarcula onubensis TaxID=2950539 RepID=A0ABU2FSZ6_9EURY|nr:hypothetical protein [Halomicroarcula sp. S3CR25-11]MDS0283412.1 hypothetical protein [Halomicroarcula sp. S3CR25-11]